MGKISLFQNETDTTINKNNSYIKNNNIATCNQYVNAISVPNHK